MQMKNDFLFAHVTSQIVTWKFISSVFESINIVSLDYTKTSLQIAIKHIYFFCEKKKIETTTTGRPNKKKRLKHILCLIFYTII